ncbi:MAG: hypothetical protein R3F48_10820 [Candidatus Zixiibacteriota bacterium]
MKRNPSNNVLIQFILLFIVIVISVGSQLLADDIVADSAKDTTYLDSGYILIPVYTKPVSSTTEWKIKDNKASLWINNNYWIKAKLGLNDQSVLEFEHIEGEVKALCLYDKTELTEQELRELVISNAKKAAYDAKVVFEEIRLVNDAEVLCLRIDGTINTSAFTYFGYYYTGVIGTIQLITISEPSTFDDYQYELESFLDGLEIRK